MKLSRLRKPLFFSSVAAALRALFCLFAFLSVIQILGSLIDSNADFTLDMLVNESLYSCFKIAIAYFP